MPNEFADKKSLFNKNLTFAGQCFIKTLLSAVMCFIVFFSITTMTVGFGTRELGYKVLHSTDGKTFTDVYIHYNDQGEDKQLAEYINNKEYYKESIRSELGNGSRQAIAVISQAIGLVLLFTMLYGATWKIGDSDENRVTYGHMPKDTMRGFKIGLLAAAPYGAAWLLLLLSKSGLFIQSFPKYFKFLNYHLFHLTNLAIGTATRTASQLSWSGVALALLLLLPLPIFCALGYVAGYKHFSLRDKIIYKNDKKRKVV